ncbi:hypothetical protein D3C75_819590 [compost metagenome]
MRIHPRQCRWDRQVEHRQGEGFRLIQRTIQNGINNGARIFNRDTFAGAVPAGVDQIRLRARGLHAFHQHFCVLRWMQRQEGCAEAGGEGRGRLRHAALGTGQFGGKTRQEVILGLAGGQSGDRWQHAKRIGSEENHFSGVACFRYRLHDIIDVIDRVTDAGIFGF